MIKTNQDVTQTSPAPRLPAWLRQEIPDARKMKVMKGLIEKSRLHTVCESAQCPNLGKCWGRGVATFMILGEVCSRACRFCAVKVGRPARVDPDEPRQVAFTVKQLNLSYVVITSVTRDDLEDGGAGQFAQTIQEIRTLSPRVNIEILIPDFLNKPESLEKILQARPDVVGHNIETVRRLSSIVRPQADYARSLEVLRTLKHAAGASVLTKSSLMVGLGETEGEVVEAMRDLRGADCEIFTVGQYLAPSSRKRLMKVERFVTPQEFDAYQRWGAALGFKHVESGPLVRSSFIAEEGFHAAGKKERLNDI